MKNILQINLLRDKRKFDMDYVSSLRNIDS